MAEVSKDSTIWDVLSAWGKTLPDWQRYIVSHAVRDGTLSDERIDEAYQLFLRSASLDEGTEELPAIPASVTGRDGSAGVGPLTLKEIKNLKNVNAIPDTSELTFGLGLTVVYGHNAAGKSGFARMLSAACFCRSEPKIIGNIYDDSAPDDPASAEIVIDLGNASPETVAVTAGDENEMLRRISVFDASVARIHLAKENELGFQPTGFDVFDEVGRVMGLVSERLDAGIVSRTKPNTYDKLFADDGPLAQEITRLSASTDISALRKRCEFGEVEQQRLEEVIRQEKEALAKSPIETLKALAVAKTDIETVRTKIGELAAKLGSAACMTSAALLTELKEATLAASKAGAETVGHPDLTRTGTPEWEIFIESSRSLGQAEKVTYPETDDPCLLCHRPLDEPSASLIRRFWGFLDSEARVAAKAADEKINACVNTLKQLPTDLLPEDGRLRSDLSKIAPDLVSGLDGISKSLTERRDAIAKALDTGALETVPSGDIAPSVILLNDELTKIEAQKKQLQDGKFDKIIAKLKAEHIDLRQRQVLSKNIEEVAAYVVDLQWIEKANSQKRSSLTTRFLTDKQKGIFKTLIAGPYKTRLEEECTKLDCTLPIEFTARGSGGRTLRGLKVQGGYKPDEIFSEGEQRALALADFLTEVNLNPAGAAIIFDDPVTSMDHQRKFSIARRLVEEAKVRQVVIFTHDLVFLTLLSDDAENQGLPFAGHWVDCQDGVPGYVIKDEIPANTKVYRKTTKAKEFLAKAKKASGREKVDYVRSGAGALRRTIEEVVIFHLFKDTVRRWNEQVRLGAVTKIRWSDDVADEIVALQDDTSRLLEGHSNSDEFAGGMPDTDGLEKLIARVDDVIAKAKQERK